MLGCFGHPGGAPLGHAACPQHGAFISHALQGKQRYVFLVRRIYNAQNILDKFGSEKRGIEIETSVPQSNCLTQHRFLSVT